MRLFEGTVFDRPPECQRCGRAESDCNCPTVTAQNTAPQLQTAKLSIEKRKRGKLVTVIRGLIDSNGNLNELAGKLKSACGAGGTCSDNIIEIQGDHLKRLHDLLREYGYRID